MSQLVNAMPPELTELRAVSTANGGTALTTALGLISLGKAGWGADYVSITPRNFSENCKAARYLLNPYLHIVYTTDLLVSPGTNLSDGMQDGDTDDNNFTLWDTLANGCALYVGAAIPFLGCRVDMGTTVSDTATTEVTIKYWNGGSWVDTANSNGTESGNVAFAQDGDETWTVQAAWQKDSLLHTGETTRHEGPLATPLYWTRWEVNIAMKADMDIIAIQAINRATTYAELMVGQTVEVKMSDRELASVQGITSAGTANLVVNVGTLIGSEFE